MYLSSARHTLAKKILATASWERWKPLELKATPCSHLHQTSLITCASVLRSLGFQSAACLHTKVGASGLPVRKGPWNFASVELINSRLGSFEDSTETLMHHRHFITAQRGFRTFRRTFRYTSQCPSTSLAFSPVWMRRARCFPRANAGAACIGALREASSCQTTVDCEAGGYVDFFFWRQQMRNWWKSDGNFVYKNYLKQAFNVQPSTSFNSFPVF